MRNGFALTNAVFLSAALCVAVPATATAAEVVASCTDGGGHSWRVHTTWGDVYTSSTGVRKVANNDVGFTSAAPDATTVDYSVKMYDGAGTLLQTLTEADRAFNFLGGSAYLTRNPVNPPEQLNRARVVINVGDGNDGYGNCSVTFVEPGGPSTPGDPGPLTASGGRPFSSTGPWNARIPAGAILDSNSTGMVSTTAAQGAVANMYEYGDPVYTAASTDPLHSVTCTESWGTCEPQVTGLRIPSSAQPNVGSDGRIIVVDPGSGRSCDFWRATRTSSTSIRASWATCVPLTDVDAVGPQGGATGANINALAGVVRTFEARSASNSNSYVIPHALSAATGNSCSAYRYPATKSDGSGGSNCMPEGARFRLDPNVNVDALPGITPLERAVAKSLQQYGGYNRDNCGAHFCLSFENPQGESDPYPAAGFAFDYYQMPHIPWFKLQVLRQWDGR